ncbi:MAG: OmpA family protein [Mucilaginibacter polytrichastri]|nr:OmpA family protein [Mucilaginibacter polytrichastri]
MKKILILLALIIPAGVQAQSLMKMIKDRAKQSAANIAVERAEKAVNRSLDAAEKPADKAAAPANEKTAPAKNTGEKGSPAAADKPALTAYSKYDFIPGQSVFYADEFAGQNIGELPTGWNSNGSAEVVTLNGMEGNWLKLAQNAWFIAANKTVASKDFTVEFDLVMQFQNLGWGYPDVEFGLTAAPKTIASDNELLRTSMTGDKKLSVLIQPGTEERSHVSMSSYKGRESFFYTPSKAYSAIENFYGKISHVAMQFQGERLRVWINGDKVYDLPQAIPAEGAFNRLFFHLSSSNYKDEQVGVYLSHIKMANGLPDMRSKLLNEGHFSTTGILFDTNASTIKAESAGVLREIAAVLSSNAALSIRIIGHTDSDGTAENNQKLSLARAEAVKNALANEYGIDAARLQTAGKGATAPVAGNTTSTGKARNRRVEFVKI